MDICKLLIDLLSFLLKLFDGSITLQCEFGQTTPLSFSAEIHLLLQGMEVSQHCFTVLRTKEAEYNYIVASTGVTID